MIIIIITTTITIIYLVQVSVKLEVIEKCVQFYESISFIGINFTATP